MEPFEQLSAQDKRTVIGNRWQVDRNLLLKATVESMQAAWTGNDIGLILGADGQRLFGSPVKQATQDIVPVAPHADALADIIAQALKGKVGADPQEIARIAEETYKRLQIPSPVVVHIKNGDADAVAIEGKQHKVFPQVLRAVKRRDNVWLAGGAGTGKTFMISQIAQALGLPFFRISCGPQTPASIVFGHTTASGGYAPGIAYQALTAEGAVLLFDEFDRMNPAVAVMVNGLLDGNAVTFPNGETLKPKANTVYAVAANTFGQPTAEFGTAQRQDHSTMSRFVKIAVDVDERLEKDVFGNNEWVQYVQQVRKVVAKLGVTGLAITPRASEYGVRMLADGETRKDTEDMLLWAGVPQETLLKIKQNLTK